MNELWVCYVCDACCSTSVLYVCVMSLYMNESCVCYMCDAWCSTSVFNCSLSLGVFPASFTIAYITPLLKKSNLVSADVRSYRPIYNLSVLSKLLERLVARQLLVHLTAFKLLPELQSACRSHQFHGDCCSQGAWPHSTSNQQ